MDSSQLKLTKEIGDKIRTVREEKNLTQEQAAKKAGINTSYFAFIERGKADTAISKIAKIVKALGVKSSDILPF